VLLEATRLHKRFGGVQALKSVSFGITRGEFLGLIGPNGSGKTTMVNCLTGFVRIDEGEIRLEGRRIDRLSAFEIARLGLGRSFQVCKIFRRLTVLENLQIPGLSRHGSAHDQVTRRAGELLDLLGLSRHAADRAGELSGGQQRLAEFAMLLMLDPSLILLDEPFAGVHPDLKQALHGILARLNADGRTILMVSHDMSSVFQLCGRILVLDKGEIVADGPPAAVRDDPNLAAAYLGV
jgi:ABC-type branched-subunit amino acid transport system ATPase component